MKNNKWGGSSSSSDLTKDPTDLPVRFSRGLELLSQSEVDQARLVFEGIIDEDPDYAPAHFGMGCVFTRLGLRESAEETLNRALELNPVYGEAHLVLARLLYDDGDFLGGYEHVNKAVQFGVSPDKGNELIDSLLHGGPREDSTDISVPAGTLKSVMADAIVSEDKPFKVKILQRLNMFLDERRIFLHLIILLVYVSIVYSPILFGFPKGGDSPNALTMIRFLEKNWPHIPKWNQEWGCGYPFLTFYQPLGIFITFLISNFFSLSIFNAYKIIMFMIILFSTYGVYFFARLGFDNELIAFLSSILFLLTPGSFNNLTYWGFFIEYFGYPFLFATLIFFNKYRKTEKSRFFIISILFYSLLLLSHSLTAIVGTAIIISYGFWVFLSGQESFIRTVKNLVILLGFGVGLVAFWYLPFLSFGALGQYSIASPFTWGPLTLQEILGLPGTGFARLAPWTVILAIFGVITALRRRGFSLFLSFWSLIFIFYLIALNFNITFIYGGVSFPHRYVCWASIFLSMLGANGLQGIAGALSALNRNSIKEQFNSIFIIIFVVLLTLPITLIERNDQIAATDHLQDYRHVQDLAPYVNNRIAISPKLGGLLQTFNLVSNQSQLFNYQMQSAPNLPWLGLTNAFLFGEIGSGSEVVRLCRWFGIEYVLVSELYDPLLKYDPDIFEVILNKSDSMLLRFRTSTDFVSATNARRILVIADLHGYENTFSSLIFSDFNPETDLHITRSRFIDDYDLNELHQFDVVVLYGYECRGRDVAFQMLEEYVSDGGRLFIDTGYSPDSNAENLPSPCPVSKTEAIDLGTELEFTIVDTEIIKDINFTAFSPLLYGDAPWGVSYSFDDSIRVWGRPLLSIDGHPIVVFGEYGEGRVVWSGLNLPYHIKSYENREEAQFLLKLLDWLYLPTNITHSVVSLERPIPERIIVTIDNGTDKTSLLLRETYYPKWHAFIEASDTRTEIDVYRVGPDLMSSFLPDDLTYPARVVFEYKMTDIEYYGNSISILTFVILIFYIYRHIKSA